jgi:type I restriction enzyme S subunit
MVLAEEPIGSLCLPVLNGDPSANPDVSFQYIDISSIDVDTNRIHLPQKLAGRDAPARARRIVHANDVLVSTVRPERGAVAIVPHELHGEVASTALCVLRANPQYLDPKYLYYRAMSPDFREYLTALTAYPESPDL